MNEHKNIFVIGLNDFNRERLETLRGAESWRFHGLIAPPMAKTLLQPTQESWQVIRDLANDRTTLEVINDEGRYRIDDIDLEIAARVTERYQYSYGSYDSVSGWTEWQRSFKRGAP